MRIAQLSVTNFRSVGNKQTLRFRSQYGVLVGANNAGKTNLLTALEWVLHRSPFRLRIHRDDYFDPAREISIEALIGGVSDRDKKRLYAACSSQQQRGKLSKDDDPIITLTLTISPMEADEEAGQDDEGPSGTGKATLGLDLWGFPIRQKVTDRRAAVVQMLPVSAQRRIDDDLSASAWTPYGRLMRSVLEASPEFTSVERLLTEINSTISDVFAAEKNELLRDAQIVSYVDDIAFQLTKENNPVELLRNLEVLVTDHGREFTLDRLGTGTQSVVIIAMLELALRTKDSPLSVLAIEEPDAFIHPHGVRHLAGLIRRIATDRGTQVLLSTHSPALTTTLIPGDIVRVVRCEGQTVVFQPDDGLSDVDFTRRITQDTAELLFSSRVVLVEGDTERFLLPAISRRVTHKGASLDFSQSATAVINVGGKSGLIPYLRILDAFSIEARAILDRDFLDGPELKALIRYLSDRGHTIDDSDETTLRLGLLELGIAVLSKGEIEDYVPVADVVATTGRTEQEVRDAIVTERTGKAFEKLFGSGKPQYALALAAHYENADVPEELERLILWAAS